MSIEKIKFGIENVYVARLLNEKENTYDTPKPLEGAVSFSVSSNTKTKTLYADNKEWVTLSTNGSQEGELEVYFVSEEMQQYLFERIKTENGLLLTTDKVSDKKFALLGQYSTDKKKRLFVYYLVSFAEPAFNLSTKTEEIDPKTVNLKLTVTPLKIATYDDNVFKSTVLPTADGEVAANWFSKVTLPTGKAE